MPRKPRRKSPNKARRPLAQKPTREQVDPRYMVPCLSRGLALLQLFTRQKSLQTLIELAEGLDISRSAAFRLVYTLEKEGFVERNPATRRFHLTSKVLTLGFEYFNSQSITELAQPYLRKLSDATSASSYVVILDGWHAVYLARVAPPSIGLVSNLQVGSRQPAHLTASGRILLAHLPEDELRSVFERLKKECRGHQLPKSFEQMKREARGDRARGHVFHESVLDRGLASCAFPVCDSTRTVAAVTVVGPIRHLAEFGGEAALVRVISEATLAISKQLGFRG
jgi:IclR family pca regulon transcriptional regulator